ncbi:MAG: flavin reductase family protein [Actinomycetota bacterium]|nr:flavin reductase family protein [Actinomycetota bacterium]MDQ2956226.1 flavin reductase family protein [Actinomycetota bacterium]
MSIHNEHPFLPAEGDRNPVRRLRGRLASPVTVLTAEHDGQRAGLTVSSLLVVDGEPGSVIAVIDPLSELREALQSSAAAVVNLLGWQHRQLADAFGYVAPAPGGPFRLADWTSTRWGPALDGAQAWAGCRLSDRPVIEVGWGLQVQLDIEHIEIGPDGEGLVHHRGRYHQL